MPKDLECYLCGEPIKRQPYEQWPDNYTPRHKRMPQYVHIKCADKYDPSPWCSGCGAIWREQCECGPIADND